MSRRILTFSLFESAKTSGLTPEQAEWLDERIYLRSEGKEYWTYNPATGLVDVYGHFGCSSQGLSDLKGVKFGQIRYGSATHTGKGSFSCDGNKLTSLEGAPQYTESYFWCHKNRLTSLEGAPQEVGGSFRCEDNELTSLKGAPREVKKGFDCSNNQLTSLEGAPREVGGEFNCRNNQLTSLEGAPRKVFGDVHWGIFDCESNQLTSLEGAPQYVAGPFFCRGNPLTTLKGAPQKVGGGFSCDAFELERDQWNLKGWLSVLEEGSPEAQKLILTILPTEVLNREIQKDPAGMVMKLKEIWNEESFRETRDKLIWPKGYEQEADLVGDLDDVGF